MRKQRHPATHRFELSAAIAPAQILTHLPGELRPVQGRLAAQELLDVGQVRRAEVASAVTPVRLGLHGGRPLAW